MLVHWYREVVMNDGIAERTLRQFREIETPVNTLALGDSHVKWGIQPKILAGSFNFAMPGERYVETFYRLQLSDELALTPDVQLLLEPALNPQESTVVVFGLRLRLAL